MHKKCREMGCTRRKIHMMRRGKSSSLGKSRRRRARWTKTSTMTVRTGKMSKRMRRERRARALLVAVPAKYTKR